MLFQASSGGIESFFRNGFFCLFVTFRVLCLTLAGAASIYLFICLYRSGAQLEYEFRNQNSTSEAVKLLAPSFVLRSNIRHAYCALHAVLGLPLCALFIFIQSCYHLCCAKTDDKPPPKQGEGAKDVESDGKVGSAICVEVVHFVFYLGALLFLFSFLFVVGNTRATWTKCTAENDNCKLLDHMQIVAGFEAFLWLSLSIITTSIFCILHDLKKKMTQDTRYENVKESRKVMPLSPVLQ